MSLINRNRKLDEKYFKSENLFRTCSIATKLGTSLEIIPIVVLRCCAVLANYGTVAYPLISFLQQHCYKQCYKRIRNPCGTCRFGQLRNSCVSTHFIPPAALLQAVLQANTEPLRNDPVKNDEESSRNEELTGTCTIPAQRKRIRLTCTFKHEVLNFIKLISSHLLKIFIIFQIWKIFLILCAY